MRVIHKNQNSGKTDTIIREAEKNQSYVVCQSRRHVEHVAERARELGVSIALPITFHEFLKGQFSSHRGAGQISFVVDDLDILLAEISRGVPIKAISLTREKNGD